MKKISIILCMLLLMCNTSLATTYYENDVTPPWGKISIEGGTFSNGVTYLEDENITVKIDATDDMCEKEEIKYYISTSKITGNTVINESDWKSLADDETVEIKLASTEGVQHVYAVFKDLNGNTSFVSTNKNQTLTFNVNGGTNPPVGIAATRFYGEPFVVTSQMPKKDGTYFVGWSTDPMATAPSFRGGDIIPSDMVIAGDTLYAIYTKEVEYLPTVSEKLEIGNKVNLEIPYTNQEVNGNKSNLSGWKVLSENDDGSINLVSSGTPLTFYHGTNAQNSIDALTTNFLTTLYDSNGFESSNLNEVFNSKFIKKDANGTPMVRSLTAEDILKATRKSEMELGNSMALGYENYFSLFDNDTDYWVATSDGSNNLYTINPSGEVGSSNSKELGVRVVITVQEDIRVADKNNTNAWNVELNGTIVNVDGLGDILVEGNKDAELEYNPDTGKLEGIIPPSEEPEEVPEIPEEKLNLIEFNYGKFEENTSYTPGEYITVEYEETKTRAKTPVKYQNIMWSHWLITVDEDGNEISKERIDIAITDCNNFFSDYVVYDLTLEENIVIDGVPGDTLMMHAIYNTSDDNQENAVYLAAYLNKYNNTKDYHVAKWNGTNYAKVDCDNDINAVTVFTENYIVKRTENVQVKAPNLSTEYVYIPVGTLKATEGMTWGEWLESDYNITGETDLRIKTPNFEDISYDAIIVVSGEYGLYKQELVAGLYDANDNLLADWDTLVNEYGLDVSKDYFNMDYDEQDNHLAGILKQSELSTGTKLIIGNEVTSIGEYALGGCKILTSITIPNSVINISKGAFIVDVNLINISIPNGITKISNDMFRGCIGLTSIEIADSVTQIENNAFYGCSSLASVIIPDSVTSIGINAFYGCSNLTNVTFENTSGWYVAKESTATSGTNVDVTNPSTNATNLTDTYNSYYWKRNDLVAGLYDANDNLLASWDTLVNEYGLDVSMDYDDYFINDDGEPKTHINKVIKNNNLSKGVKLIIGDGVTKLGGYAFHYVRNLTTIIIPNSVTSIGNRAFYYCNRLTNVKIPNSVTSIGDAAFAECSVLTSITIPNSVISIESSVFSECSGLTSVTIPDSVTSIGSSAFSRCSGLTSVTIGDSVASIGNRAFYRCSSLASVTFENTSGWSIDGTNIDVTNPATNAMNLTDTYVDYYWNRN